jgi:hypothetical protein
MDPIFRCLVLLVVGFLSLAIGGMGLYKPKIMNSFGCIILKRLISAELMLRWERWMNSPLSIMCERIVCVWWLLFGALHIILAFIPPNYPPN